MVKNFVDRNMEKCKNTRAQMNYEGRIKMSFLSRLKLILVVAGVVFIFMGGRDIYYQSKTPANYNELLEADYEKGMIVEGNLYANYGAFEENYTTTNGIKTGSSKYNYMIPVGEEKYMGLLNDTSTLETLLDDQMESTYAYIWGESTSEPDPVYFKGRVLAMDSETKGYLKSYMIDIGFTAEEAEQYILPYYIKCENYEGGVAWLIVGIIILLIGGIIIFAPVIIAAKQPKTVASDVNVGGTIIEDDFGVVNEEENSNDSFKSAFNEMETNMTTSTEGLGTEIVDEYANSTEESTTGLSLRLKD